MPTYDIYTLPESEITISGGGVLSGGNQGTGEHLDGLFITLNSSNFQVVTIDDDDNFFADNDSGQTLPGAITYDGEPHGAGLRVEAEYRLTVEDSLGNQYVVVGFNINETGASNTYGTVEGLAFLDDFPPVGVPLEVVGFQEGPGSSTTLAADYYVPPCFASGTRIATPDGERCVETLKAGDLVTTLDRGAQPLLWVGSASFSKDALIRDPALRPIEIGTGDAILWVSPQHRVLLADWRAEMTCGGPVLVAAKHLAEAGAARAMAPGEIPARGITYWHILFDRHEIVSSNGHLTESFRPGPEAMKALPDAAAEFRRFFPDFAGDRAAFSAARPTAARYEARVLAGA